MINVLLIMFILACRLSRRLQAIGYLVCLRHRWIVVVRELTNEVVGSYQLCASYDDVSLADFLLELLNSCQLID